jgi:hypothetical protein
VENGVIAEKNVSSDLDAPRAARGGTNFLDGTHWRQGASGGVPPLDLPRVSDGRSGVLLAELEVCQSCVRTEIISMKVTPVQVTPMKAKSHRARTRYGSECCEPAGSPNSAGERRVSGGATVEKGESCALHSQPLRSLLFCPGDSERKIAKALEAGADAVYRLGGFGCTDREGERP